MCCASSDETVTDADVLPSFEEIQTTVTAYFDVTESYLQHSVPTFHVNYKDGSKEAFLKLMKRLESMKLLPILRENNGVEVLQVLAKPPTQPNRNTVNIALFFATLGTVFVSGYLQAADIVGALLFTAAIMAILGSHEMGHKLLADKHEVDATYPYFIPGLPPIGTFGALIRQKELPPNKDALFDIGFTGPITGFIVAVIVTVIGIQLSTVAPMDPNATPIAAPLMFQIVVALFPPSGVGEMILLHPVAYAGWVGMIVTMLNLVPSGMFDGGHIARSTLGENAHRIISYLGIALLAIMGWWPMAVLALFFSSTRHPGPLDDVSKLTTGRKIKALILVAVFILSVVPIGLSF
jgi:hypothetical protein